MDEHVFSHKFRVVTSLDRPYAITNAITEVLKTGKKFVPISMPSLGMGFVNEMRRYIPYLSIFLKMAYPSNQRVLLFTIK